MAKYTIIIKGSEPDNINSEYQHPTTMRFNGFYPFAFSACEPDTDLLIINPVAFEKKEALLTRLLHPITVRKFENESFVITPDIVVILDELPPAFFNKHLVNHYHVIDAKKEAAK